MGLQRIATITRWQPSEPTIFEVSSSMEAESNLNKNIRSKTLNGHITNGVNGVNGVNGPDEMEEMKKVNRHGGSPSDDWNEEYETIVRSPFDYQYGKPGKDFRRQLLKAFNVWLRVEDEQFKIIDTVVAMLHNASLLIDDIQDGSKMRRGSPAAHCVFGIAQSINSANYVYFLAQKELLKLDNAHAAFRIFNEEMMNLHRGQGIELFWREEVVVPHESEYLMMISNKTGGLFRLGARLLQSASRTDYDVVPLADVLGIVFQIYDDYKNLCSDKMAAEKGYCEDLTEGKFSFPIIHALRNSPSGGREILNILRLHTENVDIKSYAVKLMKEETKSLDYTKTSLRRYTKDAQNLLAGFDQRNPLMEQLLNKMSGK